MTLLSHIYTQARVQPRNSYNHTNITFLPGQNNVHSSLQILKSIQCTSNLYLKINNTALPMTTHPKVLGLTLDPNSHTEYTFTTSQYMYRSLLFLPLECGTAGQMDGKTGCWAASGKIGFPPTSNGQRSG